MTDKLDALLARATIRIGPAGSPHTLWGSGFFVAPGWALTCAHVLRPQDDPERVGPLRVTGANGLDAEARLAYCLGGGPYPEQDLALVRVAQAGRHACARLTDRYGAPSAVTAHGWRAPNGGPAQRWQGQTECNGKDGAHGLTLAPQVEIPHGASGGPLLDRDSGLVAGVVKARRRDKDGGLAVAVTALRQFRDALPICGEDSLGPDPYAALVRAHDIWHEQVHGALSWVAAQEDLARPGEPAWSARDSAEAAALLAALPPPDSVAEVQELVERVSGEESLWEEETAPHDWRDGHGWLYDSQEGADLVSLHYLRVVAAARARRAPDAAAALERWVERRAERLPNPVRALLMGVPVGHPGARHGAPFPVHRSQPVPSGCPGDGDGPVVAVELEPDLFRPHDRFHWRIWEWTGGPDSVRVVDQNTDGEGASLAELPHLLGEPLSRAFRRLDTDRRTRLEIALPVQHFGMDVHLWRPGPVVRSLRPHPAERPFGVHREVVLRSLARRGEPGTTWRERWAAVTEKGGEPLPVASEAYAERALTEAPPNAVPVLCRPPAESTAALTRAISEGFGVILWSLRADHSLGCGAECGSLLGSTTELLGTLDHATALPDRLRSLRERISQADTDAEWAEHLALCYDDPRRPIPLCDDLLESP
ncbi:MULTISPECIES: trypsin-like peptidase domain-containing protein [unclassified Streptomyces]|uniref:VMAP-C domain-containing protein n=1 Tax=unclassified Streptomyces TaxID=2593676 RepID=UPI0020B1EAD0|nr:MULTISPECIES: trypsin-like peptidase domain-containing protein [unclassified Streptomyces]